LEQMRRALPPGVLSGRDEDEDEDGQPGATRSGPYL
jgi:hypothetical protein